MVADFEFIPQLYDNVHHTSIGMKHAWNYFNRDMFYLIGYHMTSSITMKLYLRL